jgi:hypothetical protein
VFGWVLKLVAGRGLLKGERIGVDGSTMEANAALRTIVRRDNGESYRAMLTRMAQESGIETPTAEDLARFDRKRKGKTLSNADWKSPADPDARIAKMKDGTTHLASHGRVRVKRELCWQRSTPSPTARSRSEPALVDASPCLGSENGERETRVKDAKHRRSRRAR